MNSTEIKESFNQHFEVKPSVDGAISVHVLRSGKIEVTGNVTLRIKDVKVLPVRFGTVYGSFDIGYSAIDNLAGAPSKVYGSFIISDTAIRSLEGSPEYVYSNYACRHNNITSLNGITPFIGSNLILNGTNITNLIGITTVAGDIYCVNTPLKTLQGITKLFPDNMIFFENTPFINDIQHNEKLQIDTVRIYPEILNSLDLSRISKSVALMAIREKPSLIRLFKNPSRMIQLAAVTADISLYKLLSNPDPLVTEYFKKNVHESYR